jgi:hypothetical protein
MVVNDGEEIIRPSQFSLSSFLGPTLMDQLHFVIPVNELPYNSVLADVREWQDNVDYKDDHQPEFDHANRYTLGFTGFNSERKSDVFEACKAVLPEVYVWLVQNAPEAIIKVGEYNYCDPENFVGDGEFDPTDSGDATVWVDFGDDHASAAAFKSKFVSQL